MKRILAVAAIAATLTGCAFNSTDAYQEYLDNNPDPSLILTPEDAQTRALLGCGGTWEDGTIDGVLAKAYAANCKRTGWSDNNGLAGWPDQPIR